MSKSSSPATGTSGGAEKASVHAKGAVGGRRNNMQVVQNVLLIWLDENIDDKSVDCHNTLTQLRRTVNTINIYTNCEECIHFLENTKNEKACMIISGALGQRIVPRVHQMSQVDSIFIFCGNKKRHEQWAKEWPKIKGIYIEISPICDALKQAAQQCEQNATSFRFMAANGDMSEKKLNQLNPSFMYTQIIKEILLSITFDSKHVKEYTDYCTNVFSDNEGELINIKKFKKKYRGDKSIWWYTFESFVYPMLNRALRLMDVDIILKMGFFICDLHRQIEQLHKEQFSRQKSNKSFTMYRGQGIFKADFDQLIKTKGGLMSFNNFLSTSKSEKISLVFAQCAVSNPDLVGILFVMRVDPAQSTTAFASTTDVSYYKDKEDEILFAMNTVFRICNITPMGENNRIFQVELTLTNDNDKDLGVLTDHIRKESFPDYHGWYRLGAVLITMGEFDRAEEIYETLLEQKPNESEKALIYHQLGTVKYSQGKYGEAAIVFEKSIEIRRKAIPLNQRDLANSTNDLGNVYRSLNEFQKALSSYEETLAIYQKILPPNHPDVAKTYNNIGLLYYSMGQHPKAFSSHKKALEIKKQSLPPNHPSFAITYHNIGLLFQKEGENSTALKYYEKALEIRQQSLPPNHSDLAVSYNSIGPIYESMADYEKAHSFYERAVGIAQQSLPSNHPNLQLWRKNLENAKKRL